MNISKPLLRRILRITFMLVCVGVVAYLLYFHRLASLLPGYSIEEIKTLQSVSDWHFITYNPLNFFYTVPLWFLTAFLHHGIVMTRVVAAIFGTGAALLFFVVARARFTYWLALLSTLLFATSSGFLHSARFGSPQILLMGVLLLIAAIDWYKGVAKHSTVTAYVLIIITSLLLYIPGMIWFELFSAILLWPTIKRRLRLLTPLNLAGWLATATLIVAPLAILSFIHPQIASQDLGTSTAWQSINHFIINFIHSILSIGVRGSGRPVQWLGHAPLLTAAETVLVVVGLYKCLILDRSFRSLFTPGCLLIGLFLMSLGGLVSFVCVLPLLYLLVAEGLSQLVKQWFAVFPRNPVAQGFSIALILIMVGFIITYHTRAYFVAWPHTTATRQVFTRQP